MEENRKRNVQINFRVDREEYNFIVEKAKVSGKRNLTQYLLSMAIAGQTIHIELDDIKILSASVGRFASSANQIAKRANATGNVYDEDIKEIKSMEREIWRELKSIRLKLYSISL